MLVNTRPANTEEEAIEIYGETPWKGDRLLKRTTARGDFYLVVHKSVKQQHFEAEWEVVKVYD